MPTNVASGSCAAIGIRLPPLAHPSSSTRQRAGATGYMPNSFPSDGQVIGMRLRKRQADVGHFVVGGFVEARSLR